MASPNFTNRTLWTGDNLDIMRGMNSETVDLIYLDPPFNSNKTYEAPVGSMAAGAAFKDTWTLSDLDVAWMGLIADEHPNIAYLLDASGRVHGKGMQSYLTMMAVRLLEMRRLLKPTGSIYLHCDPYASHYLKLLLDAIFGRRNFQNEVIWFYRKWTNAASYFQRNHDVLLSYRGGVETTFNKLVDRDAPQAAKYERGWDVNRVDKGIRQLLVYDRVKAADKVQSGQYDRIVYREDERAVALPDVWEMPIINSQARERVGYPTQKPVALLERIIKASSNEGDIVLDPFAGCATACVAAERLGRQWAGIDISPKAVELVQYRLKQQEPGIALWATKVVARTDIPRRTDIDAPIHYRKNAHVLFGQQEGKCAGCVMDFPFKIFEVDHVIPRSKGGTDHLDNLQLLCPHCNRVKGGRSQEYLVAALASD